MNKIDIDKNLLMEHQVIDPTMLDDPESVYLKEDKFDDNKFVPYFGNSEELEPENIADNTVNPYPYDSMEYLGNHHFNSSLSNRNYAQIQHKITNLDEDISELKAHRDFESLKRIQSDLNKIFENDAKCNQVIYTNNVDKSFFGVMVVPRLTKDMVTRIMNSDDKVLVKEYYVEIDSKLIDSSLNSFEITACILQNIGSMIADSRAINIAKMIIDKFLVDNNTSIKLTDNIHYNQILAFGIADAMRKSTSMFFMTDIALENDEFIKDLNLKNDAKSALQKLRNEGKIVLEQAEVPTVVLAWVLRLYNDILHNRIAAIHTIKKGIKFSPSTYEKKTLKNIIQRLERIDDDALIESASQMDAFIIHEGLVDRYKKSGMRGYEEDLYELKFNANNMETQEDAILLIHQINSRMSVIMDYMETEKISKSEYKRWKKLYDEYDALRKVVSSSKIYQNKTRIYVNYGFDD